MFETTVFIVPLSFWFCLWIIVLSRCCVAEKQHFFFFFFRLRWKYCTPSLHNTTRTGSTARAWWSKYPTGLNLIHWGEISMILSSCSTQPWMHVCQKTQGSELRWLKCYLSWRCKVILRTKGRSSWPRTPGWRDDRRCHRRVFQSMCKYQPGCVFSVITGSF